MLNIGSGARFAYSATPTPSSTPPHADSGTQLTVGSTISSALSDPTTPDRFLIVGAYGDLLSVGAFPAQGQNHAPDLTLYAPDGSVVGSASGAQGAVISALQLPSSGAYILYVQAGSNDALGSYTVSLGSDWILRDLDGGPLKLEAAGGGALPRPADRQSWQFRLTAGMRFTVSAQPANGTLDPVIELLSPLGDRLAVAHDFGANHNARTNVITAPTSGVYQLRISAYANQSVGAYELIARAEPATPTPYLTAQPINQNTAGHVGQGAQYGATFQGVPGQVVTIEVHSKPAGAFDPVLELYGPSGRRVAINDDAAPDTTDAALHITLNDGVGTYAIRVSGYALTAGDFTLSVQSP